MTAVTASCQHFGARHARHWVEVERRHFAEDPSRLFADLLVRQLTEGDQILSGSAGTVGADQTVTDRDRPSPMC
jgi:hypothetical protein